MEKTSKKSRWPLYVAKGAIVGAAMTAGIDLMTAPSMNELAHALEQGKITLYLPSDGEADINILGLGQGNNNDMFRVLQAWETDPSAVVPVYVFTQADKKVCQIYLKPGQVIELSQVSVSRWGAGASEQLAAGRKICMGKELVPGSMETSASQPHSVVAPEGRVAMDPVVVTSKMR